MKPTLPALILSLLMIVNLSANDSANLIRQGDVYDQKLQPEEALKFYLPAEKLTPNDAALLVKIAKQYVYRLERTGPRDESLKIGRTALSYAERAVKLAPESADTHLAVAISWGKMTPYFSIKEKITASRLIKASALQAVKLNPKDDYAWHLLGRWHQALAGMNGLARAFAEFVYGAMPAATNADAVECFQKAITLKPTRLLHHIELGRTYAQMGEKEEATKCLQQGLSMPNTEKDDAETKLRGRKSLESL